MHDSFLLELGLSSKHKTCSNGDVGLTDDRTPYMYWDFEWYPICGHFFWDNNVGATLICNKLGNNSGAVFRHPGEKYLHSSFKVGKCNINENLLNCTGGCNDYQVGGYCGNQNMNDVANGNPGARCEKNYGPKISVQCHDSKHVGSVSCDSGNWQYKIMHFVILKIKIVHTLRKTSLII